MVFTDPYYPGWVAGIDGVNTEIFRANYAFRSIVIPQGKHSVTFTYSPDSFKIGLLVSVIGIVSAGVVSFYVWKLKSQS
jgi:uncharacterized membrane protein YfhO